MKTHPSNKSAIVAAGIALGLMFVFGGYWLHTHEEHTGHTHGDGHGTAQPELNAGARWESDEQLRSSMVTIRDAFVATSSSSPVSDEAAKSLTGVVDEQIGLIVKNCRLSPKADATLHYILSGLARGAHTLSDANQRQEGLATMGTALNEYPQYFDHPDWQPLPHDSK